MIKKIHATVLIVGMLSITANAQMSVNWATTGAALVDGVGVANGSLAQLIWTPFNATSAIDIINPAIPTGNDYVLASTATLGSGFVSGGTFTLTAPPPEHTVPGTLLSDGWAYIRVFNQAAPDLTGYYGDTTPVAINNWVAPQPPQSYFAAAPIMQAIPEPSVMALMGLGGLLVAIRRRRMIA
jgi:hypothetical protein